MIIKPEHIKVTEWKASTTWFDESGIFYSIYKKGQKRSMEETVATIREIGSSFNGKKICILADITHMSDSSKELRDYAAQELPKYIKAIAMVSYSALGKMLANIFITLKAQPYPTRIFGNEADAREWLKQYL